MKMKPQDVHLQSVDTSKGVWGIFVQSVVEPQNRENLFVALILEQNIDDEHIKSRKLKILVSASDLQSPSGLSGILNQIRTWIDITEGDGFLDGVSHPK
jgi:hypothetical protein